MTPYPSGSVSGELANPDLRLAASLGHTPDSFARALLAGVLHELALSHGAPVDEPTVELRVSVDRLSNARKSATFIPHVSVCVHLPNSRHGVCIEWPPVVIVQPNRPSAHD